jgi:flagellar biosynthesis chaperone FliJ
VTALGTLEGQLAQGTERTRAAQEEARTAVQALGAAARESEPDLAAASADLTAGVQAAQQVVAAGQDLLQGGVAAVQEALARLLGEAQQRLQQTQQFLSTIRDQQEQAVDEAIDALAGRRDELEQQVVERVQRGVTAALDPELERVSQALANAGQQVVDLATATDSRGDELARQLAEVEQRIRPAQESVERVKAAAEKVGIGWS